MISDFKTFPIMLETIEFWCVAGLKAILRLLQRKNSTFFYTAAFIVTK